jgi:hypothetical protein
MFFASSGAETSVSSERSEVLAEIAQQLKQTHRRKASIGKNFSQELQKNIYWKGK